ncbi:MAG: hypothetical protein V2I27_12375 [Erythrobacter sp.]|jgi:hypothetical protein|nr:hypothetical protein [Erythrobacter sp.]
MAASPALAQMQEPEPDAEAIARTPLEDLNIDSEEIPQVLLTAEMNPYADAGLATCNAIVAEIAALDQVLGADYDIASAADTGLSEGSIAKSVVGSLIPFRGIVREVSGAAGDQRKLRAAVAGGMVRRGFLKGLGQARGCSYPARPKPAS